MYADKDRVGLAVRKRCPVLEWNEDIRRPRKPDIIASPQQKVPSTQNHIQCEVLFISQQAARALIKSTMSRVQDNRADWRSRNFSGTQNWFDKLTKVHSRQQNSIADLNDRKTKNELQAVKVEVSRIDFALHAQSCAREVHRI